MPIEQPRHELDVVDAIRIAAVNRLVASDEAANTHRSGLAGRPPRLRRRDDDARRALVLRERRGKQVRGRGRDIEPPSNARRDDSDLAARRGRETGVSGRPVERSAEPREVAVGSWTADSQRRRPAVGQGEHRPQPVGRDRPVDAPPAHLHRPREGGAHTCGGSGELCGRDGGRLPPDRQDDGLPREPGQRGHDDARGRGSVQLPAGGSADHHGH